MSKNKLAALILLKYGKEKRVSFHLKLLNELLKNNGDDIKGGMCALKKIDLLLKRIEVLTYVNINVL